MQKHREILKNDKAEITRLSGIMEAFCEANDIPMKPTFEINLVMEEILMNIISYGYQDGAEHEIEVIWWLENDLLHLEVKDDGVQFDPLLLPEPDLEKSVDERKIGGLGIHLVKKMMCDIRYERRDKSNILMMKKKIR